MKTVGIKMPASTVINENYSSHPAGISHPELKKSNSTKNVVALPEVTIPTKKFRMRSLLWVKPTGVAVSSTSSLLAQVCTISSLLALNISLYFTALAYIYILYNYATNT